MPKPKPKVIGALEKIDPLKENEVSKPLTKEDVNCPICLSIIIEPVTLPCNHSLCKVCFETQITETSLCCAICKKRISNWSRSVHRSKSVVNNTLWERIKAEFPVEVQQRLEGRDSQGDSEFVESPTKAARLRAELVSPGKLKEDFEIVQRFHEQDLENRRKREEEESLEIIKQLLEQEGPAPEGTPDQVKADFDLAKKIQEEENVCFRKAENFAVVTSNSNLKQNKRSCSNPVTTSAPKRLCPQSAKSETSRQTDLFKFFPKSVDPVPSSTTSTPDSMQQEFNQIRHINPAPVTPPKDGSLQSPVIAKPKAVRRDLRPEFHSALTSPDQQEESLNSSPEAVPDQLLSTGDSEPSKDLSCALNNGILITISGNEVLECTDPAMRNSTGSVGTAGNQSRSFEFPDPGVAEGSHRSSSIDESNSSKNSQDSLIYDGPSKIHGLTINTNSEVSIVDRNTTNTTVGSLTGVIYYNGKGDALDLYSKVSTSLSPVPKDSSRMEFVQGSLPSLTNEPNETSDPDDREAIGNQTPDGRYVVVVDGDQIPESEGPEVLDNDQIPEDQMSVGNGGFLSDTDLLEAERKELERYRLKAEQEEKDRELARKLQKQLDREVVPRREQYETRYKKKDNPELDSNEGRNSPAPGPSRKLCTQVVPSSIGDSKVSSTRVRGQVKGKVKGKGGVTSRIGSSKRTPSTRKGKGGSKTRKQTRKSTPAKKPNDGQDLRELVNGRRRSSRLQSDRDSEDPLQTSLPRLLFPDPGHELVRTPSSSSFSSGSSTGVAVGSPIRKDFRNLAN